jgi:PHD/YefM family antitoxin component YafN of YafNO toxin-antitoxin module
LRGLKIIPRIIPIRDLKKTSELSELCRETNEPVFITKNGYGEMVIMSMDTYEKTMLMNDIYRKVNEAEQSVSKGDVTNGFESLRKTRVKHDL